jgi:uncharacterized membrane protein
MTILILGLIVFLSIHSIRIVADDWRTAQLARLGEGPWKGIYSLVSAVGLGLIVWGFGIARAEPIVLWSAPAWTRHAAALLTLVSFILITAAYIPGNRIKAALGHPMLLGVKLWAFGHLIANGRLADVLLFGAFLVWAVLCFRAARRRDRAAGTRYPEGKLAGDLIIVVVGIVAWAVFALYLHGWLIGVKPYG